MAIWGYLAFVKEPVAAGRAPQSREPRIEAYTYAMKITSTLASATLLLLSAIAGPPLPKGQSIVKGVVTDIVDDRITKAAVTFESNGQNFQTTTGADGRYSMRLEPGTYTIFVGHLGFCSARRAAFVVRESSELQFDFQLWVCPSDSPGFHRYKELDQIPHTDLKPLVLYGESQITGDFERFTGATTFDDGPGHRRRYRCVFSFNLLTVQADNLSYNFRNHVLVADGDVSWQAGNDSGTEPNLEIQLNSYDPHPNRRDAP